MKILDVSSIQDIPGYVEILKFVLKSQIQNLVEQLQDHAGEETLVLSANLTAGTLSHLESDRGQGFLDMRENIKSQFLTHCLQGKQKYHTAEPPGHRANGPLQPSSSTEPPGHRVTVSIQPNNSTESPLRRATGTLQPNKNTEPTFHRAKALRSKINSESTGHTATGLLQSKTNSKESVVQRTTVHQESNDNTEALGHRGTGPLGLHNNNTMSPIYRATVPLYLKNGNELLDHKTTGCLQSGNNTEPPDNGSAETLQLYNKTFTNPSSSGLSYSSIDKLCKPESIRLPQTGTRKMIEQNRVSLPQTTSTQAGLELHSRGICQDVGRLYLPGNDGIPQHTISNTLKVQPPDRQKNSSLVANIPDIEEGCVTNPHSTKESQENRLLPGPLKNLPAVNQSISGCFINLPTINQSEVKDVMSDSLNAQVLPQFLQPLQSNTSSVKLIYENHSNMSTIKSAQVPSLLYPETFSDLLVNQKSSPVKTTLTTNIPYHEKMIDCKTSCIDLVPENILSSSNCSVNSCREKISKTTKRKQKRSSGSKLQSKNISVLESPIKKVRLLESEFSDNHLVTSDLLSEQNPVVAQVDQTKSIANVQSVAPVLTNFSTPDIPNNAGFSLLKMRPVVLIDDPNQVARKVFIESGSLNPPIGCSKTSENAKPCTFEPCGYSINAAVSSNRQIHVVDGKEKDKTKKTLSSKIDEITQRITKDDAIKQHTVQTSDCEQGREVSGFTITSRNTAACNSSIDSLNNESSSHDVSTPPSAEHLSDGDSSKFKDGSRASHRKPKLPRFNIGVASDDEDNAEVAESTGLVSPETLTHTAADINPFGTPPSSVNISHDSSVNISHDDTQDIINIQVSGEESETAFPHINLEEFADGLLLTDIPIVSYYNNVEESSKSLIESVFNLKPGRDPSTKKPLNSQSVIVSGSKLEKDWVKCPLCPDKFLTVEALQYHIKNVNHVAKRYECDLCKRKFGQLRDMERHRRIHTGERPFTCDICKKSFARKDNLKSHARKYCMK